MIFKKRSRQIVLPVEQSTRVAQFVSLLFTIAQRTERTERHAAGANKRKAKAKNHSASAEQLSQPTKQNITHDIYPVGLLLLQAIFNRLFFYTNCSIFSTINA